MQSFLNYIWYRPNFFKYLLWPFSLLYRFVIAIRHLCYALKIFKTHRVSVPVIVVGNITVGGTGKTPLVIALVTALKDAGFRPGVVIRGYGGKAKTWPQSVDCNSDPVLVGDEAVLIAKNTGIPVMAGSHRAKSANQLIKDFDCNVIVSDDGLQHYALARDIEIAVVDSTRRYGNGFCLPAGPLREPKKRLKSVDFMVSNGLPLLGEYPMQFAPQKIISAVDASLQYDIVDFMKQHDKKVVVMAGIGNPERFFQSLRLLGFSFEKKVFPDHYLFSKKDIDVARDQVVLMTEKDVMKCHAFADERHFYLKGFAVVSPQMRQDLLVKLRRINGHALLIKSV